MSLTHRQQWDPRYYYASPAPSSPPMADKNNVEMNREMLLRVLEHFSTLLPVYFDSRPVRLVIHGGACMLLHPQLYPLTQSPPMSQSLFVGDDGKPIPIPAKRTATRDVDYINRSFAAEWKKQGIVDATERLKKCIRATARQFGLGADWMNSDADIALPMASNPQTGAVYDPIYADSLRPNNVHLHTIFTSRNQQLTLISVTPFWAVALKLVRYCKWDPGDICALLRNGTLMSKVTWTAEILEGWLHKECWPMGYASYDTAKVLDMRKRIQHAVTMVNAWNASTPPSTHTSQVLPAPPLSAHNTASSSTGSRFAPEAWSMGGQGTAPAPPPGSSAWSVPPPSPPALPTSSGHPHQPSWGTVISAIDPPANPQQSSGHWSAPSTTGHHASTSPAPSGSQRDSWIGGWAIPLQNASSGHIPPAPNQAIFASAHHRPALNEQDTNISAGPNVSSLGLSLGRETREWTQPPPEDHNPTPKPDEPPYSQVRLARPRQWSSGSSAPNEPGSWQASLLQESLPASSNLPNSRSAPIVPVFDTNYTHNTPQGRPSDGNTFRPPSISATTSSSSNLGLPLGFVAAEGESPWDWYGLSEEEKEAIMRDRLKRAAPSSPYTQRAEPRPEPVIPREDLLQKTPPTNKSYLYAGREDDTIRTWERGQERGPSLTHRASQSFSLNGHNHIRSESTSTNLPWHPDSAERAAKARERDRNRLIVASSSSAILQRPVIPDDEDIWQPYHGRGVAADNNLRHSQSLGVL